MPSVKDVRGQLRATEAKKLIREVLAGGHEVVFTRHALEELEKDGLTTGDVLNVLRGGVVREGEWENGTWRYRVETPRIAVVVEFDTETRLVVVTAWRKVKR